MAGRRWNAASCAARPCRLWLGLEIATGLCKAVAALHRAGVIHRDIKPDNVILQPGGGLRLIDLGVARLPQLEEFAAADIPGTPSFMAPELLAGTSAGDERSDLYALGVTLYRLFSGAYPYGEIEAFSRPRFGAPASLLARRPDLPSWLDQALARAVAVAPEERFGDAVELLFALERGMAGGAPARPRPRSLHDRNPLLFWRVVAAVLAVAVAAVLGGAVKQIAEGGAAWRRDFCFAGQQAQATCRTEDKARRSSPASLQLQVEPADDVPQHRDAGLQPGRNSSGVSGAGGTPWPTSQSRIAGSAMMRPISSFSRATIGAGVPAGAKTPRPSSSQTPPSPASARVGTSGRVAKRVGAATASGRSVPPSTCACASDQEANMASSRPASSSGTAWPPPRKGMWVMLTPAVALICSIARWKEEPTPMLAKFSVPGSARALASSACTESDAERGPRQQQHGQRADRRDRHQVALRVEIQRPLRRGGDDQAGGGAEQQAVPVRRGFGDRRGRDVAAGAAAILHHHGLAERRAEFLPQPPGDGVRAGAGREADGDGDGAEG